MTPESQPGSIPLAIHDDASALDAVLRRVRLLARRRLFWLNTQLAAVQSAGPQRSELDGLLADWDDPSAESAWQERCTELNAQLAAVEATLAADTVSRLAQLRQIFGLEGFDEELLHVCLAAAIDPDVGRLYAYCHDDATRAYPTLALAARLCGHGRFGAWSSVSPLRRWRMVAMTPSAPSGSDQWAALALDPAVRNWLSGSDDPDPAWVGRARLVRPQAALPEWDVAAAAAFAGDALDADPTRTVAIQVIAPPGSGRKTFAACIASQLGMPLLAVDARAIAAEEWELTFIHIQRHAFLQRVAVAWSGLAEAPSRRWVESIAHFPVQFILREGSTPVPSLPGAVELRVELPVPGVATRARLWAQYAPQAAAAFPEPVAALAARFNARPGAIAAAAAIPGIAVEGLAQALRDSQRDLLDGLAQPLECPFAWDDLVVTAALREALCDFVHEAEDRARFWEQPAARRLFPQGRGLAALFTGLPGTGKTMAAQVIAAELRLDLFRIDLSTVVSKYVGETAHNLQRILTRAAEMDVVLFFDEADALFARRTEVKDAHDRFANTDTNHLLQALENYAGVAILATNRKGNIDPAFIRRLRYVLEFPKPDAAQRLELWRRLLDALAGDEIMARQRPLLERLAAELELTGAQIKYAVLTGVFAARRDRCGLCAEHLLRGIDREMAKEGRALSERERVRLR